ncbi:hypothetical protein EV356DRAFT_535271 [Viridothelium virens]|uniref:Malate dehydrogenase n=1 Tax=Viridothelium virens TaxID=1048519 RepID=A0A6A6H160_VIRVR|nr:hypothetical protein EV356DRAFT_535271 [Viridothelium virens]
MLYQRIFSALLIAVPTIAAPWYQPTSPQDTHHASPHPIRSAGVAATSVSTPVLPVQTPNTLPPLSDSLNLRVIALGVGTQNYTCSQTPNVSSSAPVSVGANATLYDVTELFTNSPQDIGNITETALLQNSGLGNQPIGHHFFTYVGSTLTPTFDLDGHSPSLFLSAVKENTETAPVLAYTGLSSEGAVPWLFLQSDTSGLSEGMSEVYRVETAGGAQPSTCADKDGDFQVPYSAEYWFYG